MYLDKLDGRIDADFLDRGGSSNVASRATVATAAKTSFPRMYDFSY